MAKAVFGSKISPNIIRTPENFIVCQNVPIARLGTQKYLGSEIGLDETPDKIVTVYRLEEEVFKKSAMASFEGKPFTDEHPCDWVDSMNVQSYSKGSVFNVRRGEGQYRDCLVADIIVYNQAQIDEIINKDKREISCGYECQYTPYKDGYMQSNIIGNHVALVTAGRAGSKVAIKDNSLNGRRTNMTQELRLPRKGKISDFLKSVGLQRIATDAAPEDIMDAVNELVEEKLQEEKDAEPIIIEKTMEPETNDEEVESLKEQIGEVRDAIYSMLSRDEDSIEEDYDDDSNDDSMDSLDELVDELENEESCDNDMVEEVESVEMPTDEMNELEDNEEVYEERINSNDSIIELVRAMKPMIAAIPDAKKRKKVSDDISRVLRKQARDNARMTTRNSYGNYSKLINGRAKDSRDNTSTADIGMKIAQQFNPSYMKK